MPGREGRRSQPPRRTGTAIFVLMLIPVVAFVLFFLWGVLHGAILELRRPAHTEASALTTTTPRTPHRGDIVLILDDVGFDHQPLAPAMAIDPNVNFAVLPNGKRSTEFAAALHGHAFELL